MPYRIGKMTEEHRTAVTDILNFYITDSFAAYLEDTVGYEAYDRFMEMANGYPSVVIEHDTDGVVGFAFLRPHHLPAKVFRRAAEITYFIMPGHTGNGLGTTILKQFIEGADKLGVDTILANISSLNEGSLRFHRRHGFQECGRFVRVGRKFGQDFDVIWMQLFV